MYKGLEKGLVCNLKQDGFKDCRYKETLDDEPAREAICDFYSKWPKDIPCAITFDEATCVDILFDEHNCEMVTI